MDISKSYFVGILIIVIGVILKFYPPKHINNYWGYRTTLSMKCEDTWNEGNRLCGIMFVISGIVFTLFSMLINYLFNNNLILAGKISTFGLIIALLISVVYTEIHLRNLFDKNGVRK